MPVPPRTVRTPMELPVKLIAAGASPVMPLELMVTVWLPESL